MNHVFGLNSWIVVAVLSMAWLSAGQVAIAAPKSCLDAKTLQEAKRRAPYMLFDRSNPVSGVVNVREKPSARSALVQKAQSRNPVDILAQVTGEDGFCWLRVEVTYGVSGDNPLTATGWVRGDLVVPALDP